MKRTMKKMVSLGLVAAISLTMLVGCGNSKETADNTASLVLVINSICDTAAILASASPLKPSEDTVKRSSIDLILLVACLLNAISISSFLIPEPLSVTVYGMPIFGSSRFAYSVFLCFDSYSSRPGIYCIFNKLFYNRRWSFYNFSCRYFINCILIK